MKLGKNCQTCYRYMNAVEKCIYLEVGQLCDYAGEGQQIKQCAYCGATKALTKHSLNGNHKAPFVIACEFCHAIINGASQKSFEVRIKRLKRTVKRQQQVLELLLEKRQPDGTFLISSALNANQATMEKR